MSEKEMIKNPLAAELNELVSEWEEAFNAGREDRADKLAGYIEDFTLTNAHDIIEALNRIPTLPDVMEDGYMLREVDGIELLIDIRDGFFFLALATGPTTSYFEPSQATLFNLPDLSNYQVQDGKIVKVEG